MTKLPHCWVCFSIVSFCSRIHGPQLWYWAEDLRGKHLSERGSLLGRGRWAGVLLRPWLPWQQMSVPVWWVPDYTQVRTNQVLDRGVKDFPFLYCVTLILCQSKGWHHNSSLKQLVLRKINRSDLIFVPRGSDQLVISKIDNKFILIFFF